MKTVYVADLDGTLLTPEKVISPTTRDILNRLMDEGMHFTIATARTIATVRPLLRELNIRLPMIMMNGVCTWNPVTEHFDHVAYMDRDAALSMLELLRKHRLQSFLYTLENDRLGTYYEDLTAPTARQFVEEREKIGKKFTQIDDLRLCLDRGVIYCSVSYPEARLRPVYDALKGDARLHIAFYRDVYSEDLWYLEVCAAGVSKYHAVRRLRESGGFDRVVSFGDNYIDLPMFEASDESCAVSNALEDVKRQATYVIGSNSEDGVARYLESLC